jgi:hypothetical protein
MESYQGVVYHHLDIKRRKKGECWTKNGRHHRENGPAWTGEYTKYWYNHGQLHRIDGPAGIWIHGTKEWWINDKNITEEVNQWMKVKEISWPWDGETQVEFLLTFA